MTDEWEARVQRFWVDVDVENPFAAVEAMRAIVADRPEGDAEAL